MKTKWTLIISAITLGVSFAFLFPDSNNSLSSDQQKKSLQKTTIEEAWVSIETAPTEKTVKHTNEYMTNQQTPANELNVEQSSTEEHTLKEGAHTRDAFPDTIMLEDNQITVHERSNEEELDAERSQTDMYYPVQENVAIEPSHAEIEHERLQLEALIAQQAHDINNQPPLSENEFNMPAIEQ